MVPAPLLRTLITDRSYPERHPMTDATFDRSVLGYEAGKLLEALLDRVDDAGRAQVPTTVLLKASGLTQGALVRARNELTQRGLLRTEPGFSANGLRGANIYALNLRLLGDGSSDVPDGESGQNRTGDLPSSTGPATSLDSATSTEGGEGRRGLLSRLFRRSSSS
jgi:hypothetical protein